jgi:predicted nucleic acid-binding protein
VKVAFVDTLYFVALFNPRDQWHEKLKTVSAQFETGSYNVASCYDVAGGD